MRSWKVGYTQGVPCLKFHYQDRKDSFVWVTITGEKAVFLALCLHSAVNELLRVRGKKPLRTPKDQVEIIMMIGAYNIENTCMMYSPFETLKWSKNFFVLINMTVDFACS